MVLGQTVSPGPQRQALDLGAAGEFPELFDDGVLVHEELVADDGMGDEDDEQFFLHHERMGVGGVGDADELGPFLADAVFDRVVADTVFDQQLVDEGGQLGGPAVF